MLLECKTPQRTSTDILVTKVLVFETRHAHDRTPNSRYHVVILVGHTTELRGNERHLNRVKKTKHNLQLSNSNSALVTRHVPTKTVDENAWNVGTRLK